MLFTMRLSFGLPLPPQHAEQHLFGRAAVYAFGGNGRDTAAELFNDRPCDLVVFIGYDIERFETASPTVMTSMSLDDTYSDAMA
jgi:2-keto-4-pentenoate hydratase/2-oxohepta-3-ene-1,7-dioic acid hydratase in catechol pathway